MITRSDITNEIYHDFRRRMTENPVNGFDSDIVKAEIAASVNAYFASNPACAAGEELLKAPDLSNRMLGEVVASFSATMGERSKESIRKLIAINDVAITKAKGGEA